MISTSQNIDFWSRSLGLLPVTLHGNRNESKFVLLNGGRGNFCLNFGESDFESPINTAWSADVGHYITVADSVTQIYRWNRPGVPEEIKTNLVVQKIQDLHKYLQESEPSKEQSVVRHIMNTYRCLRALMRGYSDGMTSLNTLLVLLASATDNRERESIDAISWGLSVDAIECANTIKTYDWEALVEQLTSGKGFENLSPILPIVLRHAAGQLFQEAHYVMRIPMGDQMSLEGFIPAPAIPTEKDESIGVHFTPSPLARTIVEESLFRVDLSKPELVVFDPACGSGEFLKETLRQLAGRNYTGKVHVIGWDILSSACAMTNFVLNWEKRCWDRNLTFDVVCCDALKQKSWPEKVDVIMMNPPFMAWRDLKPEQKELVEECLKGFKENKPDLSAAFIYNAAKTLKPGGVLGAVVPASLFDGESSTKLRQELSSMLNVTLVGRLGSQTIFSKAIIDSGVLICSKKVPDSASAISTKVLWSDYRQTSSESSLRRLRKDRHSEMHEPIDGEGYSIYAVPAINDMAISWAPRPYTAFKMIEKLKCLPTVSDIFEVSQGARTGWNDAFLIERDEYRILPDKERKYFRPAVVNKSIRNGQLDDSVYIFFPFGEELSLESEEHVVAQLPEFYKRLSGHKSILQGRKGVNPERWWELTRHRKWQIERIPKIVSSYYGTCGSFSWDKSGDYVVVQGWAWLPKKKLSSTIGLAYIAYLNSPILELLLSGISNNVGGGQWTLSKQFIKKLPLPDLLISSFRVLLLKHCISTAV